MDYINIPNLPQKKISGVLVDYRTPEIVVQNLKKMDISVFKSMKCDFLYNSVCGHPDMTFTHIKDNIFVCEPRCYSYYKTLFPSLDIICGNSFLRSTYPDDIAYNIARVGDLAFHNAKYTDKIILEYFDRYNVKLINVKQGYSKCSICVVDEISIITSDRSIAAQAEKYNIDVLLIQPGYIQLYDLDYGFIGGCTGKTDKNTLAVSGNLIGHTDFKKIEDFCSRKNVEILTLSDSIPVDIGSILPIYY